MDELQQGYYELGFRLRYLQTGDAFQDFFATLMELRYPGGDFARVALMLTPAVEEAQPRSDE